LARLLPEVSLSRQRDRRRIETMHDEALLNLLNAILMASSMMLTWQVYLLRKPKAQ
jgi:hypothetical protein